MKKVFLILFLFGIASFRLSAFANAVDVELSDVHGTDVKLGHDHSIHVVKADDTDITISCDSVIHDVTIVICDQYGNVKHQSTITVSPMESTIFAPDTCDGREKSTIDLYYDRKHLRGDFIE